MSGEIGLLAVGAALGSLVFGVSGFAFALTASAIWLQAMPPAAVVPLVVTVPLVLNLVTLPQLRRDIDLKRLAPFAAGSTLGIPLGVAVVARADPGVLRIAIAVLLVGYSVYALSRSRLPRVRLPERSARAVDAGVGLVGGVVGGISGLSVVLPSLWIGMRGLGKAEERGLIQSFGLYCHVVTLTMFAGFVGFTADLLRALAVCLPIAVVGSLVGLRLFRRMSGEVFRRSVLWIILAGGLGLLARAA